MFGQLSLGFSQQDISPTNGKSGDTVSLWGFGPKGRDPENETAHRVETASVQSETLLCQALCLKDSSEKPILVISLDLGALGLKTIEEIKTKIIEQSGNELNSASISINVSHTHGAPIMVDMPGWQEGVNRASQSYLDSVKDTIVTTAIEAFKKQGIPVEMCSQKMDSKIAHNRRATQTDMHDPRLSILSLRDTRGQILGIIGSTACHPVTMRREVSSDFVGVFRKAIQKKHPKTFSMFLQGFAATSNPNPELGNSMGYDAQNTFMNNVGNTLAQEVLCLLERDDPDKIISEGIYAGENQIHLPFVNTKGTFDTNNPLLGEVPYKGWVENYSHLNTELLVTQQLLLLGFLEDGRPLHIGASSHEVDGSISRELQKILGDTSMMIGYTNGVGGYMTRPEDSEDSAFPFPSKSPLNYEAALSHLWYGNIGPLSTGWYETYKNGFERLLQDSQK